MNWPISSLTALAKFGGVAEPCAELGTSVSVLNSAMNDWAMTSKPLGDTSVLAGIEPFFGLNAACPSCEPQTFSQPTALSRSGAPLGSPKVSHTIMYLPLVPGEGTTPKSVFGTQFLAVKSPLAQSRMMCTAAVRE